jgi:DNA polymerase III delta prime subunit
MTKKKSIEKLERIIVDLQRFWKNNSVPNMFIYGPNEDDVEYVINTLFNKEYGDSKKDMILDIDRSNLHGDINSLINKMESFGNLQTLFLKNSKVKIIHIKLYDDILPEGCANFLEEIFQKQTNFRIIISSQHLHSIPIEIRIRMLLFMISPIQKVENEMEKIYTSSVLEDLEDDELLECIYYQENIRTCANNIKIMASDI